MNQSDIGALLVIGGLAALAWHDTYTFWCVLACFWGSDLHNRKF